MQRESERAYTSQLVLIPPTAQLGRLCQMPELCYHDDRETEKELDRESDTQRESERETDRELERTRVRVKGGR
jgi:hypothetical protein